MESFDFLLIIAIILLSTKVLGVLSEKVHMPQVVGALLAGLFLGPSFLNIVSESQFIDQTAEIGVILLMFIAGLDTDIEELKKNGIASIIIAVLGIFITVGGGFLVHYLFFNSGSTSQVDILKSLFIGVALTATSVSITVETLREMGRLKGKVGTTILGAAIIDDIVSVIVLTIILSSKDATSSPVQTVFNIVYFFVFIAIIGLCIHFLKKSLDSKPSTRRVSVYSLVFCFFISYAAERFFGISDIIGAYFTGILMCNLGFKGYVEKKITVLSYLIFSPIFFASIGLKTSFVGFNSQLLTFSIVLMIVVILTKVAGCFLGAKICKFDNISAITIGTGMLARGEVSLIIAEKGAKAGLLDSEFFPAIVLVVIVTTLITPILLKIVLSKFKSNDDETENIFNRSEH